MKIIKRIILTLIILTIVCFLSRSWIFSSWVTYEAIGQRITYPITDVKLAAYINGHSEKPADPSIEQIITMALSLTSGKLNFTAENNYNDPNKLITSKTAHCIGYAAFFVTTCNYLLHNYNLSENWNVEPQIGQVYLLNTNLHKYFNSPFFKDHDFVTIQNKNTGQTFAVDPTVHDYLGIRFIKYNNQ